MNHDNDPKTPLPPASCVWIYVRFSPGDNQTLESQLDAVRNYCFEHAWIIEKEFVDSWTSGKNSENRESFNLMISLSKSKSSKAKTIVFWAASRFGRNADDASYYRALLRRNGWKLISITDQIPDDSPYSRLMETFIDMANEHYLTELSSNTIRGLEYIANQGCVPVGAIPFGYQYEIKQIGTYKDGRPRNGRKPIVDEKTANLVKRAFEMKANGATYEAISNETGIYSGKAPGSWNRFFRNSSYCGQYVFREITYPDVYPMIVVLELFEAVQKQLPAQKEKFTPQRHPRRKGGKFFLANISFCAFCNAPMEGKRVGSYRYYVCSQHNQSIENCPQSGLIPAKDAEPAIINLLNEQILDADYLSELLVWTNKELNSGLEEFEIRVSMAKTRLEEESQQAHKMARTLLLIGDNQPESVIEVIREKEIIIKELKRNVAVLTGEIQNRRINIKKEEIERFLKCGKEMIDCNDYSDLTALCGQLISRILMGPEEISIELHFPLC
jgi:site-specific DNA recombinase